MSLKQRKCALATGLAAGVVVGAVVLWTAGCGMVMAPHADAEKARASSASKLKSTSPKITMLDPNLIQSAGTKYEKQISAMIAREERRRLAEAKKRPAPKAKPGRRPRRGRKPAPPGVAVAPAQPEAEAAGSDRPATGGIGKPFNTPGGAGGRKVELRDGKVVITEADGKVRILPAVTITHRNPASGAAEVEAARKKLLESGVPVEREKLLREIAKRSRTTFDLDARGKPRVIPWQAALATDELWVIERSDKRGPATARDDDAPTQGELIAVLPGDKEIPLPLKHTDVKAEVAAFVATVKVTQEYANPYGEKIEAVYVFPLPQDAAVTDFVMTIGRRRIRGIIRERREAREIYDEAKRQGYTASLLTQERPNIFTQRVANIEPRKEIGVTITYFNTLKYSRGEYEFVFPMVVGPRFNPAGSTGGVGAVARGASARSGQPVEVPHLRPGERSGHDISVTLDIDAGVEIERVHSPSHAIETDMGSPGRARVTLSRLDAIPDKDLVVRYRVAGERMKTAMMTHRGPRGNHFALVLQPPADLADLPRMPREMVFVLDCSGSMRGRPLDKAKEAIRRCLRKLAPDDTFQLIRFSNRASALGSAPLAATPGNVRKGLAYLEGLHGTGGTQMIEGIRAALDFPHDAKRLRVVSFMTDGYIGNESEILAAVHAKLGEARIFSFGVGNAVNRHLLESMAKMGRGAVAFVGLDESSGDKVDLFYERCSRPALADIEIDWGGARVDSIYPRRIPDLFVGRPVLVTGRFEGSGRTAIRVCGRAGLEDRAFKIDVDLDDAAAEHAGIAKLWARTKLAELGAIMTHSASQELTDEMTRLSLEHSVQCRYTAFVAVDSSRRTAGAHGVTVAVPVPVPDGVRYETTVSE